MADTSEKPGLDPTFPIRLRAARLKAGLSLEDLAQKLGGIVTRQAIAKYEKGLISPSPEVLERLLQVLEIPPLPDIPEEIPENPEELGETARTSRPKRIEAHAKEKGKFSLNDVSFYAFCREVGEPVRTPEARAAQLKQAWAEYSPGEEVELRPEPRLPRKQFLALKVTLAEKMKNYLWLEKLLRQEKLFNPPLAIEIKDVNDAESAAEELRQKWDLGTAAVNNLLTFLEEHGIKTFKLAGPENFESLSGCCRGQPFIVVEKGLSVDRMRFKTVAELAQILFGFSVDTAIIRLYNRFAAAFLLPSKVLEEYFLPAGRKIAFSELAELKLRYGISLQAAMRRALDLELVTERRFRSFREMMNEKGWLWKEPVEYKGEENPTRFRRLLHYAVSSEILDLSRAAALAEISPEQLKSEMGEIF